MKLGSLFDGSGACPLAARMCGVEPVWASEIEPYPIRVTKKNFPGMRHLGDIKKIDGAEIDPVDIITFGSPCQDLSVAGKDAGIIEGKRSSLFFEAIRIIKEMRGATNGKYPRYAMWENVPGALSSGKGSDFLEVLRAFAGLAGADVPAPAEKGGRIQWRKAGSIMGDGFSVAWRILDAQYWGVPQRRKRIYLVADFGGGRAEEILFEREGLRGDFAQGAGARERAAADAAGSAGGSDSARSMNPWDCQSKRIYQPDGVFPTLPAMDCGGANNQAVLYALDSMSSNSMKSSNPHSGFHEETVAKTLQASGVDPTCNNVFHTLTALNARNPESAQTPNCVCYPRVARTLTAEADASFCIDRDQNVMCYEARGNSDDTRCPTLICNHEQPISAYGGRPPRKYIIRRLTPLECCRLQGFPDDWTDGVEGSDTAKYKMWGNGMALPCVLYVMQGIAEAGGASDADAAD